MDDDNRMTTKKRGPEEVVEVVSTLAWVRANAGERREKYRQRLAREVLRPCDKKEFDDKNNSHNAVAEENLKRGRSVLADAEKHLRMFEECLKFQEEEEEEGQDSDGVTVEDNSRTEREKLSNIDLNVFVDNRSDRKQEKLTTGSSHVAFKDNDSISYNSATATAASPSHDTDSEDESELGLKDAMHYLGNLKLKKRRGQNDVLPPAANTIDDIIEAGAALVQQEQDIAAARRRGDAIRAARKLAATASEIVVVPSLSSTSRRPKNCNGTGSGGFDPSQLEGVKRAAVTAVKIAEKEAEAEAEAVRKSNFKARPLPGGVWVRNDPYKPTKAALCKHVQSRQQQLSTQPSKSNNASSAQELKQRITSFLLKGGYDLMGIISGDVDLLDQLEERCEASSFYNIHASEDYRVTEDHDSLDKASAVDDISVSCNIEEEEEEIDLLEEDHISSLHREITKLEARMSQKRRLRSDLLLITKDNDFDADFTKYIDKDQLLKSLDTKNTIDTKNNNEEKENKVTMSLINCCDPSSAVYRRQEIWLEEREKKRKQARVKKEMDYLQNVTGQPHLTTAKASWDMAKEAHRDATRMAREEEQRRMRDKETKDDVANQQRMEEIYTIQAMAVKRKKNIKAKVDKTRQKEALEKLSRPRIPPNVKQTIITDSSPNLPEQQQQNTNPIAETLHSPNKDKIKRNKRKNELCGNTFNGDFSELDDKQFAKVIKSMGLGISLSPIKHKKVSSEGHHHNEQLMSSTLPEEPTTHDASDDSISMDPDDESEAKDGAFNLNEDLTFHKEEEIKSPLTTTIEANQNDDDDISLPISEQKDDGYHYNLYPTPVTTSSHSATSSNKIKNPNTSNILDVVCHYTSQEQQHEPYEKYEAGKIPFFDRSSSVEKGRFRVRDARGFAPETMRRRSPDSSCESGDCDDDDGVMLLVGKRIEDSIADIVDDDDKRKEVAITIMFDRSKFNEMTATEWWKTNRHRFIED